MKFQTLFSFSTALKDVLNFKHVNNASQLPKHFCKWEGIQNLGVKVNVLLNTGEIAHMLQFRPTSNCFDEQESKYFAKHKNRGVVIWSSWANLTACYHWKGWSCSPYFLRLPSHPRLVFCWVSKFNCLTKCLGKHASQCRDSDKSMWLERMLLASHYIDPVI